MASLTVSKNVKAIKTNNALENALTQWLIGKAETTKRNYARVVHAYVLWLGEKHIASSTAADLRNYQEHLKENGKSINTVNTYTNVLKSFFSFLKDESVLPINIGTRVKSPKPVSAMRERILGRSEIDAMIELESNIRNRLILQLLFFCGLRVSELVLLKWKDIKNDGSNTYIHVTGKGNKQRTLIVPPVLWAFLKKSRTSDELPVFKSRKGGKNLTTKAVNDIVHVASKRIGLCASPHWLRHSHATLALRNGADVHQVSVSLGHSSVATTSKYLHASPNDCSSLYL